MTTGELINLLSMCPDDYTVYIESEDTPELEGYPSAIGMWISDARRTVMVGWSLKERTSEWLKKERWVCGNRAVDA